MEIHIFHTMFAESNDLVSLVPKVVRIFRDIKILIIKLHLKNVQNVGSFLIFLCLLHKDSHITITIPVLSRMFSAETLIVSMLSMNIKVWLLLITLCQSENVLANANCFWFCVVKLEFFFIKINFLFKDTWYI